MVEGGRVVIKLVPKEMQRVSHSLSTGEALSIVIWRLVRLVADIACNYDLNDH